MYKSCSKCGKIHNTNYKCKADNQYKTRYSYDEDKLRNTYSWHTKAEQVKRDSKYLCQVCLDEGIYNYNNLEVHHITKIREDKARLLDSYNIICLCRYHHRLAEKGILQKECLYNLAKKREDNLNKF